MTLVAENSTLSEFPLRHGSLSVSAATLKCDVSGNSFEVVVDRAAELSVALLDVRADAARQVDLVRNASDCVRSLLQRRAPMYEIVSALRNLSASERPARVGLSLLRFSQPESRVEILNAGMPAVLCVLPDGTHSMHAALSSGIGERFGEVHPYELAPITWGSSWLVSSSGLTRGKQSPDEVRALLRTLELPEHAAALAQQSSAKLAEMLASSRERSSSHGDTSLLVVNADPTRRFRSGIRA